MDDLCGLGDLGDVGDLCTVCTDSTVCDGTVSSVCDVWDSSVVGTRLNDNRKMARILDSVSFRGICGLKVIMVRVFFISVRIVSVRL